MRVYHQTDKLYIRYMMTEIDGDFRRCRALVVKKHLFISLSWFEFSKLSIAFIFILQQVKSSLYLNSSKPENISGLPS